MATIGSLKFELLDHDHKNKTATIRASYTTHLAGVESNMAGLRFREKIQVWGSDSPDPDDFLYEFTTATFPTSHTGSVARSRTVTVGDEVLDEDGWPRPTDEIYAKVWVTPLLPAGDYKRSNEIHHRF